MDTDETKTSPTIKLQFDADGNEVEEIEDICPPTKDLDVIVTFGKTEEAETAQTKEFEQLAARVKSKTKNAQLNADMSGVTMRKGMNFGNHGKRTYDDYRPTPEELKIINTISGVDVSREDGYSIPLESADDQIDRQDEAFNDYARDKAAIISFNKAFLTDHAWDTAHHLGTIYAAVNEDGILKQKVWVLDIPENQKYIKNMLGGVYNKVSVGFSANLKDLTCSSCGPEVSIYDNNCPHTPGMPDEKGIKTHVLIKDIADFYEVSLVPIPAQREAGIRRRSLSLTPELSEKIDKALASDSSEPLQIIENLETMVADTTDGVNSKKVDTISSGNSTLGDVIVPDTTTSDSTVDTSLEAVDTKSGEDVVADAPAPVEEVAVETPVVDAPVAPAEVVETATEEKLEETVVDDKSTSESKTSDKAVTEELLLVIGDFKAVVQELKEVAVALKSVSAPEVSALNESHKALEQKLEALSKFVEAATATTFETLERGVAAQKQNVNATASGTSGNQWAVELTKGILGGK